MKKIKNDSIDSDESDIVDDNGNDDNDIMICTMVMMIQLVFPMSIKKRR